MCESLANRRATHAHKRHGRTKPAVAKTTTTQYTPPQKTNHKQTKNSNNTQKQIKQTANRTTTLTITKNNNNEQQAHRPTTYQTRHTYQYQQSIYPPLTFMPSDISSSQNQRTALYEDNNAETDNAKRNGNHQKNTMGHWIWTVASSNSNRAANASRKEEKEKSDDHSKRGSSPILIPSEGRPDHLSFESHSAGMPTSSTSTAFVLPPKGHRERGGGGGRYSLIGHDKIGSDISAPNTGNLFFMPSTTSVGAAAVGPTMPPPTMVVTNTLGASFDDFRPPAVHQPDFSASLPTNPSENLYDETFQHATLETMRSGGGNRLHHPPLLMQHRTPPMLPLGHSTFVQTLNNHHHAGMPSSSISTPRGLFSQFVGNFKGRSSGGGPQSSSLSLQESASSAEMSTNNALISDSNMSSNTPASKGIPAAAATASGSLLTAPSSHLIGKEERAASLNPFGASVDEAGLHESEASFPPAPPSSPAGVSTHPSSDSAANNGWRGYLENITRNDTPRDADDNDFYSDMVLFWALS